MGTVEPEVFGEGESRALFGNIGGGLFEGEGEVVEFFCDGIGIGISIAAGAEEEEFAGGFRREDPNGAGADAGGPGGEAGGDQGVTFAGGGEPGEDGLFVLDVVEDEEAERGAGAGELGACPGGFGGEFELGVEGIGTETVMNAGEFGEELAAAIGPEDLGVAAPEPFGVVAGEGGFAYAAKGGDCGDAALGEDGGRVDEEHFVDAVEIVLAADEVGVGEVAEIVDAVGFDGLGLGEGFADGGGEAFRIDGGDELALDGFEGRGFDVGPAAVAEDGDDAFGAVGFVAGPFGVFPLGGEDGDDDADLFEAGFDFLVPVEAVADAGFVEPDGEAFGGEAVVEGLGMGETVP